MEESMSSFWFTAGPEPIYMRVGYVFESLLSAGKI